MATIGGVITTGSHPKALWPGIKAWFGRQYAEHVEEYPLCFDMVTSDKAYEEEVLISSFGLLREKDQGAATTFDSEVQGPVTRYTHIAYSSGYIVTFEELRDDQYEVVSKRRAASLAFAGRQTEENVAAGVYNNAFSSSYVGGDGVQLCASTHPSIAGNYSNVLANSADLSETAIEDLVVQVMQAADYRGNKISLIPQSLHIPPALIFDANRILHSILQNDTANNSINAMRAMGLFPKGIVTNHYFTSSVNWFIRTDCPYGMQFMWRDRPLFDTDNEFDTKNAKAMLYMRFSAFWTDPLGLFGAQGV